MTTAIELVESHPWRLAAAASIPIVGATVPLFLHVNKQGEYLDDKDRAQINKTRNITAGVQVLACGAWAVGAYVAAKVGLAILLKVSVGVLIAFLGVISSFIVPASVLLIYLLYKAISHYCCDSSNSSSSSETPAIENPNSTSSGDSSFFGNPVYDSDDEENNDAIRN